jgi:hypothetical protein
VHDRAVPLGALVGRVQIVALDAERGQVLDAIEMPLAARRVACVVHLKRQAADVRAPATHAAVAFDRQGAQLSPLRRGDVFLVRHRGHAPTRA